MLINSWIYLISTLSNLLLWYVKCVAFVGDVSSEDWANVRAVFAMVCVWGRACAWCRLRVCGVASGQAEWNNWLPIDPPLPLRTVLSTALLHGLIWSSVCVQPHSCVRLYTNQPQHLKTADRSSEWHWSFCSNSTYQGWEDINIQFLNFMYWKNGPNKDFSNFEKSRTVIARWLDQSMPQTAGLEGFSVYSS